MVPSTLYLPSALNETIVTFLPFPTAVVRWSYDGQRDRLGSLASAVLMNPCGDSTMSSCRSSTMAGLAGSGRSVAPRCRLAVHAKLPVSSALTRSSLSGVLPCVGLFPCLRVRSSRDDLVS